jgi:hypothetical protein
MHYPHLRPRKIPGFSPGIFWCTIADVKITFPENIENHIEAIRELLADANNPCASKHFDSTSRLSNSS